jgi:pimeloyl-ACP methyl ester carboxylesterase
VSAIHLNNRLVHYELVGKRGQPIIFLHSWLGSWRYWLPTMDHISERNRAYAIDFWGFGESDRRDSEFTVAEYVEMLIGFMDNMGLQRVNLAGHGLGGMVAIRAAAQQPQRFGKLITVNTPIHGAHAISVRPGALLSRLFGRTNPTNIWTRLVRQIDINDHQIKDEIIEDTDSLTEPLIERVVASILNSDLRADLARLELPMLAVYCSNDSIVAHDQAGLLRDEHSSLQVIKMARSNHFPFLDQPNIFNRLLLDFLASEGSPVEIKAEWRRRVSQLEYM